MFVPAECTDDELTVAFTELGALERAVQAQRLRVLAELDERSAWRADGAVDTAGWVAAHDGVLRSTAVALVERARALHDLPALAAVAAEGLLSADQLDPVLRMATVDTDAAWAQDAPGLSPAQLRRLAATHRRVSDAAAAEQLRRRGVWWRSDPASGMVRLSGRLDAADGATVGAALSGLAERYGPGPDGLWEPFESRCADALVELASSAAAEAGVATVVLHATADALSLDGTDVPTLADGTPVPVEVARRLACDGARQVVVASPDGVLRLGRTARVANHHQRRRLAHRDPTCRFPGCDRSRRLDVHHLVHWADGGATDEDVLFHLCPYHHRFVHDRGWTVTGDPTQPGGLTFCRPDGRAYQPRPGPASPDLVERYLGSQTSAAA